MGIVVRQAASDKAAIRAGAKFFNGPDGSMSHRWALKGKTVLHVVL
jgi:hypothetical protein